MSTNAQRLAWHKQLVQALLSGPALAGLPDQRKLIQTHISSLVLAGDEVWKLRKPLQLDFLDFSTAALRRADCEAELQLNRRTAPALYLDVLPVTGSVQSPHIGGAAEDAIDWVLRMRRFDDALLLDKLASAGALNADAVDALARRVADFHAALPASPPGFGLPADVRRALDANLDALAASPLLEAETAPMADLRAWIAAEFERLAPLLAQRRAAGFVREGHGDLHLGNIVLLDGEPLPFDCLEFNPALRHIDVVADIAFTFMDLQRHGLPGLAWRFVSAWAEQGGDHAGLALLRLFAVDRALVRAKVALLRAAQGDAGALAAARRDLALAAQLRQPATPPRLVLTAGLSGAGKSTVALALLQALGAVRLRSDVERKRLYGMPASERPTPAQAAQLYSLEANQRTFDTLAERAGTLLDAGLSVVVDATFLRRAERDRFRALAAAHGAWFRHVDVSAPEAVLRQRLALRAAAGGDASDATGAVLDKQLKTHEPLASDEAHERLDSDTDRATLARRCQALAARWTALA